MIISTAQQFRHALIEEKTTMREVDGRIVFIAESGEEVRYHLPQGTEPNTSMDYWYAHTNELVNKVYD